MEEGLIVDEKLHDGQKVDEKTLTMDDKLVLFFCILNEKLKL